MKARFFRSDAMSERLGETPEVIVEAEWFQLTYDNLRIAPDGDEIAHFHAFHDEWEHKGIAYSDVVLFDGDDERDPVADHYAIRVGPGSGWNPDRL